MTVVTVYADTAGYVLRCVDVSSEHTPINLPTRNMSFPQEYDATITASEDLNLPSTFRSIEQASIRQQADFFHC